MLLLLLSSQSQTQTPALASAATSFLTLLGQFGTQCSMQAEQVTTLDTLTLASRIVPAIAKEQQVIVITIYWNPLVNTITLSASVTPLNTTVRPQITIQRVSETLSTTTKFRKRKSLIATPDALTTTVFALAKRILNLRRPVSIWTQGMATVKHGLPLLERDVLDLERGESGFCCCVHKVALVSHSAEVIVEYFKGLATTELLLTEDVQGDAAAAATHSFRMGGPAGITLECLNEAGMPSLSFQHPSKRVKGMDFQLGSLKQEPESERSLVKRIGWPNDVLSADAINHSQDVLAKASDSFRMLGTLIQHDSHATSLFPETTDPKSRQKLCHKLIHEILSLTSHNPSNNLQLQSLHAACNAEAEIFFSNEGAHLDKGPKRAVMDPRMVPSYLRPKLAREQKQQQPKRGEGGAATETLWSRYSFHKRKHVSESLAKKTREMEGVRVTGMNLDLPAVAGFKGKGGGGGGLVPMAFD
ncbi:hypothetical protein BDR26DRAFT_874117 [Obelidium mucronatum]|nr:hypothetical protein BDR26DRAFT_874117 [Obelidium mucronatum]